MGIQQIQLSSVPLNLLPTSLTECQLQPTAFSEIISALFQAKVSTSLSKHQGPAALHHQKSTEDCRLNFVAMRKAAKSAAAKRLQKLEDSVSQLEKDLQAIGGTLETLREKAASVSNGIERNKTQLNCLQHDLKALNMTQIETHARTLDQAEASTRAKVYAVAVTLLISGVGVAMLPVHPFIGQAFLGTATGGFETLRAAFNGDDPFSFEYYFYEMGAGILTNALVTVVSIPVLKQIGDNIALKALAYGCLSTGGTALQLLFNGTPLTWRKLGVAFAAGAAGSLAVAGIEKINESATNEMARIADAAIAASVNAAIHRLFFNAEKARAWTYKELTEGLWETVCVSGILAGWIKFCQIQHDKKMFAEYEQKKAELERLKTERDNLKQQGRDPSSLTSLIASLEEQVANLEPIVLDKERLWKKACSSIRKKVQELLDDNYRINGEYSSISANDIVNRILSGEKVVFKNKWPWPWVATPIEIDYIQILKDYHVESLSGPSADRAALNAVKQSLLDTRGLLTAANDRDNKISRWENIQFPSETSMIYQPWIVQINRLTRPAQAILPAPVPIHPINGDSMPICTLKPDTQNFSQSKPTPLPAPKT